MIKQYAKMRDSGVEWVKDIPVEWGLRALFQLSEQVKNKNKDLAEKNLLSLSYGKIKRKDIRSSEGLLPESFDAYNIIEANDIVLRLTDLQNDHTSLRVGQAEERGIITSAYTTLRPSALVNPKYLYYVIHSYDLVKGFYGMGAGVRQGLNYNEVKTIKVPFPKIDEQTSIAAYLDEQCAQIDAIVEETKASIEEFKRWKESVIFEVVTKGLDPDAEMKDSGIEWIGKIPVQWRLAKIKYVASKIGSGKTPKGGAEVYVNEGILFLRSQNIYDKGLMLEKPYYITKTMDEEMSNTRVHANDVLLNITGGSIGRCCVYPRNLGAANVNQHVSIIRVDEEKVRPQYMHLFWISPLGNVSINLYQTGGNREGMSAEAIKETSIPIPPIDEQEKILYHVNPFNTAIEEIIAEKQSLITDLESYKRSLIYETVTGKRKVV